MAPFVRSTLTALAVALFAATTGTAAYAAPPQAAPDCVHLAVDWRYTYVSNDCSSDHTLTVVYLDGTEVPCRTAAPGTRITFPGRGTQGNEVLGAVLCVTEPGT
ncbi:MAG: alpha-amylase [Streptomyces sp.]|nr:alpha-amylase [Streptomyces sp.]NUT24626.1 alpha-amylase [Streptomyces sp.]